MYKRRGRTRLGGVRLQACHNDEPQGNKRRYPHTRIEIACRAGIESGLVQFFDKVKGVRMKRFAIYTDKYDRPINPLDVIRIRKRDENGLPIMGLIATIIHYHNTGIYQLVENDVEYYLGRSRFGAIRAAIKALNLNFPESVCSIRRNNRASCSIMV